MNVIDLLIEFENGDLPDDEVPGFFQELIDTGLIHHLQGSYQRTALWLSEQGLVSL